MKLVRNKYFQILLIFVISSLLIFFRFNEIPKNLAFDEVEFAKLSLSLNKKPYIPYSPLATGHSTFYFYILLFSFKIFGVTNFALRLPSAVFGVFSVAALYLIFKKIFPKNSFLPFLLAVLFLGTRWFFNFTRFSFEATLLIFLELTSLYFLFDKKNRLDNHNLLLSGLFSGLAFNSYTPGRFFAIVPIAYITSRSLTKEKINRKMIFKNLLVFLVPFIITITPLTLYLSTHQDSRVDKLFFWKNHKMTFNQKVGGTIQNIGSVAMMFVYKGDLNGRHNYPGKPAINPLMFFLFIAGIALSLKDFKKPLNIVFMTYLLISVIPSLTIYPWENPNMLRTISVLPPLTYYVGLTVSKLLSIKDFKIIIYLGLAIVVGLSIFYDLRTYFVYQTKVFPSAFETVPDLKDSLKQTNFKYLWKQ